jgi:transposase-like protein
MLEAEADRLCNAGRYERTAARRDQRSGSYGRKLETKAGEVTLKVPKLRMQTFETAIIERYWRRESSVEEALIEMYPAGVSVRRVEDITEALWGTRVSPGTVSNLNKKIYGQIEAWRHQPIEGEQPNLYLAQPMPRRRRAQANLGRRGAQRLVAGGDLGQCRLERLPGAPQGTRAKRRRADCLRCLHGPGRERR